MVNKVFDAEEDLHAWLEQQQAGYGRYATPLWAADFRSSNEIAKYSLDELQGLGLTRPAAVNIQRPTAPGIRSIEPSNVEDSVARQLLAPLPKDEFPTDLHAASLLLARPPACLVPWSESDAAQFEHRWPASSHLPPLFKTTKDLSAGKVFRYLISALTYDWPRDAHSEIELTPAWHRVGYSLPEEMANWCNIPVKLRRSRSDSTLTIRDKRRDLMVFVNNTLVVGGEDKTQAYQLQAAIHECQAKHKAANILTYGRLTYILLVATAASQMVVLGMPIGNPDGMRTLSDVIELDKIEGRCKCLLAWINICRWIATVFSEDMLPPSPPAELNVPFTRPSPYQDVQNGSLLQQRPLLQWCSCFYLPFRWNGVVPISASSDSKSLISQHG